MSSLLKRRRMLLIAPLIVCPLLSLLVWVINEFVSGSGKQQDVGVLNLSVPGARVKNEKGLDKMAYYKKAEADSVLQQKKMVPVMPGGPGLSGVLVRDTAGLAPSRDVSEVAIDRKLSELKALVNSREQVSGADFRERVGGGVVAGGGGVRERVPVANGSLPGDEIDRLERMMRLMKEGRNEPDPEMRELNRTLDKLIAVQHPERIRDSSFSKSVTPAALKVNAAVGGMMISGMGSSSSSSSDVGNRFYDLENNGHEEASTATMIEAVIPESQNLVNGGYLRLELNTELVIHGDRIPSGTPLVGATRLTNERMEVLISAIQYRDRVYPVALKVLDQDGIPGIYVPGSVADEAAREAVGQSIGSIGPNSPEPSVLGQATNAGLQLARSLAGKKVRKAPVTIPKNHWVFLEDVSEKH